MTKLFIPSSWRLQKMIETAMGKCDADLEQARLAKEAREDARLVRRWVAEAEANRRMRLWGV